MLHAITVHDNTTANPRNPDPNRWVGYGQASIEEMAGTFISWVYLDDAEYRRQIAERTAKARQRGERSSRNEPNATRSKIGPRRRRGSALAGVCWAFPTHAVEAQRKVQRSPRTERRAGVRRLRGQSGRHLLHVVRLSSTATTRKRWTIPIGPDNRFEPGAADRGQPTHFVPQWQKSSFRVIVPKDFGEQKLTWRLTVKGKTETVMASLDPRSIIDRQKTTLEGTVGLNRTPTVTIEPPTQTIARGTIATFTVSAVRRRAAAESADEEARGTDGAMAEVPRPA